MPSPSSVPNIAAPAPSAIGAPQGVPNFGALIQALRPNLGYDLAQAASQVPQQQQSQQFANLQMQQAKQSLKMQQSQFEQQQRELLDQKWQQIGEYLKTNVQHARDPQLISTVTDLANKRGMPVPLDPAGHIDINAWRTPWDSLDPAMQLKIEQEAFQRSPGPQRDAFFSQYSGVPDSVRLAPQSFDAKAQAMLDRAHSYGIHIENESELTQHKAAVDDARAQYIQTGLMPKALADARRAQAEATRDLAQARLDVSRIQTEMMRAQQAFARANRGTGSDVAIRQSANAIRTEMSQIDTKINGYNQKILTLMANGADEGDPNSDGYAALKQAKGYIDQLQQQKSQLQSLDDQAQAYYSANLNTSTSLGQQSNKRVTVTNAGSSNPYKVGTQYGHLIYLGGDPNQQSSWKSAP